MTLPVIENPSTSNITFKTVLYYILCIFHLGVSIVFISRESVNLFHENFFINTRVYYYARGIFSTNLIYSNGFYTTVMSYLF